jgi:hypothetical protein
VTPPHWTCSNSLLDLLTTAHRRLPPGRVATVATYWVGRAESLLSAADAAAVAGWRAAPAAGRHPTWSQGHHLARLAHEDYAEGNARLAVQALVAGDLVSAVLLAGRAVAQEWVYGPSTHSTYDREPGTRARRMEYGAVADGVVRQQILTVRCVGGPAVPVAFEPAWRTEAVVALARGMDAADDFRPIPVLADALEDAGCDDDEVVTHCRCDGPHVRGC